MSSPGGDFLADKLYVTVILRLLVGRQGRLAQGDVVDVDGQVHGHFKDWNGLTRVVRAWLASRDEHSGDPS